MDKVLDFGTPVKVYLDRRFLGKEIYLGKGRISGRIVYGTPHPPDYAVDFKGADGETLFIGTVCTEADVRCFRIKVRGKKNGTSGKSRRLRSKT